MTGCTSNPGADESPEISRWNGPSMLHLQRVIQTLPAIHGDPLVRHFDCQAARKVDHGGFGGAVSDLRGAHNLPGEGGDDDNAPQF
jgi:hypothetical protein